uniref:Uncharacterized protein n=1 Tax=Acrobeloides nanus TaxID=290746 RepID=A0A914D1U0_9BILA
MGYTEVVEMLLDCNDDDWKDLLRRRHDHNSDNSPIQVMIKKMPEMAYYVFTKCVNHKEDNIIAYEYEFLDDTYIIPEEKVNELGTNAPYIKGDESGKLRDEAQQRSEDFKTIITTHPLNLMVREKHFDLLTHPLVQSYLTRRWNYTKCFYYTGDEPLEVELCD